MELSLGRSMYCHPDCHVETVGGRDRGCIQVGVSVSTGPSFKALEHVVSTGVPYEAIFQAITEYLELASGMYALVYYDSQRVQVFSDPAGMCGVYFVGDPPESVASTPALLGPLRLAEEELDGFRLSELDSWMPGTKTPFSGVRCLLANHSLNVTTGAMKRFWPTEDVAPASFRSSVRAAAELVASQLEELMRKYPAIYSLTGGYDSRVNLAAALRVGQSVRCFTVLSPFLRKSERDVINQLVRACGDRIEHSYVSANAPPAWLLELYDEMVCGTSLGARRAITSAVCSLGFEDVVHVNGNLGALAKGFYWDSVPPKQFNPRRVTRDFRNPASCIVEGIDEWATTVPPFLSAASAYNLMYLEQRGGRWMGIGETASQLFYDSYAPFCSRQVFGVVCSCPPNHLADGSFLSALVEELDPPLSQIPYSSGTSRTKRMMPRVVKRIGKAIIGRRNR